MLFAVPFLWLASTSAKPPDELYPPRWMPPAPQKVVESPYVALRDNEYAEKPLTVAREAWDRLRRAVIGRIGEKASQSGEHLPAFHTPFLKHAEVSEAIFARLLLRSPDELFQKAESVWLGSTKRSRRRWCGRPSISPTAGWPSRTSLSSAMTPPWRSRSVPSAYRGALSAGTPRSSCAARGFAGPRRSCTTRSKSAARLAFSV